MPRAMPARNGWRRSLFAPWPSTNVATAPAVPVAPASGSSIRPASSPWPKGKDTSPATEPLLPTPLLDDPKVRGAIQPAVGLGRGCHALDYGREAPRGDVGVRLSGVEGAVL